jgi:phage tail P2-like protein
VASLSLLPGPLASDARCIALENGAARLSNIDISPLLVYLIDIVDPSALPHLAWQFNMLDDPLWLAAAGNDAKRNIIKNAIKIWRYRGTPWAVETALTFAGYAATLVEWFEYSGVPGTFRVDIGVSSLDISTAFFNDVQTIIDRNKRKSAHYSMRAIASTQDTTQYGAAALYSGEIISVYPYGQGTITVPDVSAALGCALSSVETISVYPL